MAPSKNVRANKTTKASKATKVRHPSGARKSVGGGTPRSQITAKTARVAKAARRAANAERAKLEQQCLIAAILKLKEELRMARYEDGNDLARAFDSMSLGPFVPGKSATFDMPEKIANSAPPKRLVHANGGHVLHQLTDQVNGLSRVDAGEPAPRQKATRRLAKSGLFTKEEIREMAREWDNGFLWEGRSMCRVS